MNKIPETKATVDWSNYNKRSQERAYIPPETFLRNVSDPGQYGKRSVDYHKDLLETGGVMEMPYIDVDTETCRVLGHEGRHRAYALHKDGKPCMPVAIYHKRRYTTPRGYKSWTFTEPTRSCADKLRREHGTDLTAWDAVDRPLFEVPAE